MTRKSTFFLSALLTAFSLVIIGAVAGQLTFAREAASPDPDPNGTLPVAPVVIDPPTSTPSTVQTNTLPAATYPVTPQMAAMIAIASAPGVQLQLEPELVNYNGSVSYEIITDRGLIYIDANNGQVLYNAALVLPQVYTDEEQDDD